MNLKKLFIVYSLFIVVGCSSTQNSNVSRFDQNQQALIKSETWLANNFKKEGVIQTASGLQYKIIKQSNGCSIDAAQRVNLHYEAILPDTGLVFDSSYKRGYPARFPLNKVIIGWTEGVASMKIGEIRELYVHPKLAYGERGSLPVIKPNVVTQYKIELIGATCI